jgi:hypothetical protein
VLLEDYKPVFGFNVTSKMKGPKALEAIRVTVDSVNALSRHSNRYYKGSRREAQDSPKT